MAKMLTNELTNGFNIVLSNFMKMKSPNNPKSLWCVDFSKFTEPLLGMFDEKISVCAGEDAFEASVYGRMGFTNTMNPCYAVRKAIYKVFNSYANPKLGYCYSDKTTKQLWCGYYDGTLDETNDIINGKEVKCTRTINLYIKDQKIVSACESDTLIPSRRVIYGETGHGLSSYFYALILDGYLNKNFPLIIKKEFELLFDSFKNKKLDDERVQACLTAFENDFLLYVKDIPQKVSIFKLDEKIHENGQENGVVFYDGGTMNATIKTNQTAKIKTINTVGDAVKSKLYQIKHKFNNDKELVPGKEFYDMSLSPQVEEVCALIKSMEFAPGLNMNFMFTGEAGTGKSTAAQQIAAICGLPYRFHTCSSSTEETELKVQTIVDPNDGSRFINVDSEIVNAVRYGGIIEVQEINMIRREGVAACLNSVLDGIGKLKLLDGTILDRHPNCVFIFTMNVGYEGAKNLNQALLSRCFCKQEFELPETKELVARLTKKQGITSDLAANMIKVFFDVRKCLEISGEENGVCSYRELDAWAEMLMRNKVLREKIPSFPEISPYNAALKSLVSHATEDKELQAEIAQVIAKVFPAF